MCGEGTRLRSTHKSNYRCFRKEAFKHPKTTGENTGSWRVLVVKINNGKHSQTLRIVEADWVEAYLVDCQAKAKPLETTSLTFLQLSF